tara:strand:- start:19651 stop:20514 length:864 start_codon:yes stop_codon:yes gene_type:complete
MQPQPEDRLTETPPRRTPGAGLILGAAVAIGVIMLLVLPSNEDERPIESEPVVTQPAPQAEVELPPAPDIPVREEARPPAEPEAVEIEPALTLEQSDAVLRETFTPPTPDADDASQLIATALAEDDLVQRTAGLVDGLSRGLVLQKALPLPQPETPFKTQEIDGLVIISPASYARYDHYAQAIAAVDADLVASTFHQLRPLLESAYAGLGYAPEEFDNALVRALDRILATPVVSEPLEVKRVEAVYQFTDPSLEQLSSVQKQLLRMGPDNAAVVKAKAAQLRAALLN